MRRQDEKGKTDVAVRKAVEKAKDERNIEIVKNCHKKGLSIQGTSELIGLSIEQIKSILNELNNK